MLRIFKDRVFLSVLAAGAAFATAEVEAEDAVPASAEPAFPPAQIEFFEKEIRPLLADNCFECHTGNKARVGLELDRRAGWISGSDYRKVIDPDNPKESLLIKAVSHAAGKDIPAMPEDGERLPEGSIAKLTQWIEMGLPWPENDGAREPTDAAGHWSFQAIEKPTLPAKAGHPVDYFLSEARKEAGVVPAKTADRRTLYRRVHFDLLGLPPKYEESEKFANDPRPDDEAWSALIDHLMASPHYGERWARLWMDVARYSDTKGYEAGGRERRFVYSYTYRDWLIGAFNDDLPYDEFLLYQLAADQLVDWNEPEKRHLAALGFLSLSKNGNQELVLDDRLDTTFRGTMALTVSCARCHDHKFDPISTKEYYGLYGVFMNSMTEAQPTIGEPKEGPEYEKYLEQLAEKQKVVDDFLEPKLAEIAEKFPDIANRRIQLIGKLERKDRRELTNLEKVVDKFVADARMEPDKALVLQDRESPAAQPVFIRGNPSRRGEVAPRKFLEIASRGEPKEYETGSGRLEMAKDIVDPANPLTARNIVNRVWMWHFGEGIVRTVDDFGTQGEHPDHPELLDFLAGWFVENGWSVKKLHKLILTSEAWRQEPSNEKSEENMLVDAENRLVWKFDRRRLELEQMRDGMLDVVGNLDNELHGRAVKILEPPYSNRRSVYAFIDRQNLNPVFRNFDFSNPQETTAKRPNTTIPMQALFTLNSDFAQNQAAILAKNTAESDDRVAAMHRAVFARNPSDQDRRMAGSFLTVFESEIGNFAERQTDTEWSYGWGSIDEASGEVDFTPFPHWTGQRWQIGEDWPFEDGPLRYLHAEEGRTHPGRTEKECAVYRWRAPDDLRIAIEGRVERPAVGEGNGVRVRIATSKAGLVFDQVMPETQKTASANVGELKVARGDYVHFIVDSRDGNTSHDTVNWNPRIVDLDGKAPSWDMAESFSGPATPATAWSAYAHALLNTNRFLFVE
ncbi:MAG: PSD1 and planctomycete cytochrome C domain-containing protein [Verrucomicrobiales bacterium]